MSMLATNIGIKGHDGLLKHYEARQKAGGFKFTNKLDFMKRIGGGSRHELYSAFNTEGEAGNHLTVEHSWPHRVPGRMSEPFAADLLYESQLLSAQDRDERTARQQSQVAVESAGGHRLPVDDQPTVDPNTSWRAETSIYTHGMLQPVGQPTPSPHGIGITVDHGEEKQQQFSGNSGNEEEKQNMSQQLADSQQLTDDMFNEEMINFNRTLAVLTDARSECMFEVDRLEQHVERAQEELDDLITQLLTSPSELAGLDNKLEVARTRLVSKTSADTGELLLALSEKYPDINPLDSAAMEAAGLTKAITVAPTEADLQKEYIETINQTTGDVQKGIRKGRNAMITAPRFVHLVVDIFGFARTRALWPIILTKILTRCDGGAHKAAVEQAYLAFGEGGEARIKYINDLVAATMARARSTKTPS